MNIDNLFISSIFRNEKEGIPAELLPYLDVCVEIPQMGVIRSLNVHVTGALFVWQYFQQHCLKVQG
jgi:tRNA guanosine-2'-O-methyltransferase